MFISWLIVNNTYELERELTYAKFPLYIFLKKMNQGNRGLILVKLQFVLLNSGESYYLRILLTKDSRAERKSSSKFLSYILLFFFSNALS